MPETPLKTYYVGIHRSVIHRFTVTVVARSEREARRKLRAAISQDGTVTGAFEPWDSEYEVTSQDRVISVREVRA